MKGTLTDQPLAELIREIHSKGLSGTLRLEHEGARTAVYFDDGNLIFAASNIRTLRLREYLTKRNLVSNKQLASAGENIPDLKLASVLEQKGLLNKPQVEALLTALVADILRVAMLWTDGTWEYDERARLDDPVRVNVDTATLMREAAQRMPLKYVSLRFLNPAEMFSRTAEASHSNTFLPSESFILSRLDAPTKLQDLVALSGLRELDAHRVLYGLTLSGVVKREYWRNAFRLTGKQKEEKDFKATPAPASEAEKTETRWGPETDEEDLKLFLERLRRATNYYEIIDVPVTADADEIKDTYYALARRYHPDHFHLKSGTPMHGRISSAFAQATQAYETLVDPKARAVYDAGLERSRQFSKEAPARTPTDDAAFDTEPPETDVGQAEYNFREGFGALQQGRIGAALTHLAAAARVTPDDARYRAYYGKALAANERTRKLAESELQTAVKLEPSNAGYRIMLAELYLDLKFHKRAHTEIDRVLALEPNNAAAQALLRKLKQ